MPLVADRVAETTTTTGTGTVTLAGAKTGYQAFTTAFSTGAKVYYCITDNTNWEVGVGTFTTAGTTLSRDSIFASSSAGAAVNWGAGSKDVFCTAPMQSVVGAPRLQAKTGAYTVVASDNGSIINCTSGTFTVSLTAAATLGSGFTCWVWNTGTGVITIDPNSTETVDGVDPTTEFKLTQGTGVQIVCTGTAWLTGEVRISGASSIGVLGTQLGRNSSGNMAVATTGQGAMALGGSYASGADSFAAAIANNTSSYGATGDNSVAIGRQTKATSQYTVAIGAFTNATATGAKAFGYSSTAEGNYSLALSADNGNNGCFATAVSSVAVGNGVLSAINGKYAYSAGAFVDVGDAQIGVFVLRRATTNATSTVLTTDNTAPGIDDQVILPNNSAYAFTGTVVARRQAAGGTESAAWKIEGLIRREANAASTTLVASTVTAISNAPGWTLALSADTTNGGLAITATGAAATNIRWVATVQTSEVTYA